MKLSPTVPRSDFCTKCFKQYCYDPANPPSASQLPNRVLKFEDPDGSFFEQHKKVIIGASVGVALFFIITFALWYAFSSGETARGCLSRLFSCFFSRRGKKVLNKGKYARVASDHETYPLTMTK